MCVPCQDRRNRAAILEELVYDGLQGVSGVQRDQLLGRLPIGGALFPHAADGVRVHLRLTHGVGTAGNAAKQRSERWSALQEWCVLPLACRAFFGILGEVDSVNRNTHPVAIILLLRYKSEHKLMASQDVLSLLLVSLKRTICRAGLFQYLHLLIRRLSTWLKSGADLHPPRGHYTNEEKTRIHTCF